MAGAVEAGYYAVAYRSVETTLVVASMSGIAMFPELEAGGVAGTTVRREIFGQAIRWLGVLGALVAVPLLVAVKNWWWSFSATTSAPAETCCGPWRCWL